MNVLNRCKKLFIPVFKRRALVEQSGVYRSSLVAARCLSLCPPGRVTLKSASCRRWQLSSGRPGTTRCYSEVYGENSSSEKSQQTDNDSSFPNQGFSKRFNLDVLVSLLRQENAVDICVIRVPDQIKYAEYFIVVSGVSPRHLRAMALYAIKVYKFLKNDGDPNVRIEGKDTEDWMCIDFGNMVVHFMLPETRDVYELEKLWTLRSYDEQLRKIPAEKLPEDFMFDADVTK
ncbi:mitochondrial assembly of ribosomal large subunit protein 1 [Echeneis naucrates]|uniref:Mitochondrial assembly of ribosomal large subunit protein 1 n=1 Tax=Echeneis naucrates TaxID=173247 RepID=A0A665TBJ5_ECHNA|nr:mitochondrial assembly of ribosomal large subunit protein 1 [Echeneis naucrates]